MNSIKILFFAKLKEIVESSVIQLEIPADLTIADLKKILEEKYDGLKDVFPSVIVSVNQEFANDDEPLHNGDEVAFFPPVSGGQAEDVLAITRDPLDINKLLESLTLPTTGAAAIFTGIIRGETKLDNPIKTIGLEYEAYEPMAVGKLKQVADEIREKWQTVEKIAIVQRIGYLDAGTPTVVVICTAAHRNTGVFDAAKYGIDRLKQIVPIWKKEIGPNGEEWIEGDYHPNKGD